MSLSDRIRVGALRVGRGCCGKRQSQLHPALLQSTARKAREERDDRCRCLCACCCGTKLDRKCGFCCCGRGCRLGWCLDKPFTQILMFFLSPALSTLLFKVARGQNDWTTLDVDNWVAICGFLASIAGVLLTHKFWRKGPFLEEFCFDPPESDVSSSESEGAEVEQPVRVQKRGLIRGEGAARAPSEATVNGVAPASSERGAKSESEGAARGARAADAAGHTLERAESAAHVAEEAVREAKRRLPSKTPAFRSKWFPESRQQLLPEPTQALPSHTAKQHPQLRL